MIAVTYFVYNLTMIDFLSSKTLVALDRSL